MARMILEQFHPLFPLHAKRVWQDASTVFVNWRALLTHLPLSSEAIDNPVQREITSSMSIAADNGGGHLIEVILLAQGAQVSRSLRSSSE